MNLHDTLLAFSEWLDSEGLIVADDQGDERTHDQLVMDFVGQWEGVALPGATLTSVKVDGATEVPRG